MFLRREKERVWLFDFLFDYGVLIVVVCALFVVVYGVVMTR